MRLIPEGIAMKFQFDLLPVEYKSRARDTISMVLAVLIVVMTISAVSSMTYKNRNELTNAEAILIQQDKELREIIDKTSKLQPPVNEINALRSSIEFINANLDTPASNMVDFFAALEAAVPERVLIHDLSPKNFSNLSVPFSITGEGATIQDVLEFVNRLNQSGKFQAQLKSNTSVAQDLGQSQRFALGLTYKPAPNK